MVDHDVPTPSPLSTPSDEPYSLSERINIFTRPIHSQLNRLILARLPLALPPYTTNPSTYISGLLHIAPIYITFETLWQTTLDASCLPTTLKPSFEVGLDACDPSLPLVDSKRPLILPHTNIPILVHAPKVCSRTHSLLAHLRLPGLLRAGRLRADIRVLTGTPEHKIDEQLEAVSQNGRLADFVTHTKHSVETNPHVLLAYAWVLYMALFSGGRYLRASLQGAGGSGGDFWNRDPSPVRPYSVTQGNGRHRNSRSEIYEPRGRPSSQSRSKNLSETGASRMVPGLQFFNFVGDEDGEDIKREFKKRITEAEILLTSGEKEDIINEAEMIFKFMVEMVGELDRVMGTTEDDIETARLAQKHPNLMTSREPVSVAQERLMRKTRTMSENLEIKLEENKHRKPSYLEVLVTGPVTKLMHFADEMPTLRIIRKTLCDFSYEGRCDSPPGVKAERRQDGAIGVALSTLVPVLAILAVILAWYSTAWMN